MLSWLKILVRALECGSSEYLCQSHATYVKTEEYFILPISVSFCMTKILNTASSIDDKRLYDRNEYCSFQSKTLKHQDIYAYRDGEILCETFFCKGLFNCFEFHKLRNRK